LKSLFEEIRSPIESILESFVELKLNYTNEGALENLKSTEEMLLAVDEKLSHKKAAQALVLSDESQFNEFPTTLDAGRQGNGPTAK
jgi:hypothetical protein